MSKTTNQQLYNKLKELYDNGTNRVRGGTNILPAIDCWGILNVRYNGVYYFLLSDVAKFIKQSIEEVTRLSEYCLVNIENDTFITLDRTISLVSVYSFKSAVYRFEYYKIKFLGDISTCPRYIKQKTLENLDKEDFHYFDEENQRKRNWENLSNFTSIGGETTYSGFDYFLNNYTITRFPNRPFDIPKPKLTIDTLWDKIKKLLTPTERLK